jgi:hypothetical protein
LRQSTPAARLQKQNAHHHRRDENEQAVIDKSPHNVSKTRDMRDALEKREMIHLLPVPPFSPSTIAASASAVS